MDHLSAGQDQRDAAILLVRSEASNTRAVIERSIAVSLDPGRTGAEYVAALDGAKLSLERMPEDQVGFSSYMQTRIATFHLAVAAAQLRLGLYREALVTLETAERTHALGSSLTLASVELTRALAHHQLGEVEEAGAAYDRGSSAISEGNPDLPAVIAVMDPVLELEVRALLGRD